MCLCIVARQDNPGKTRYWDRWSECNAGSCWIGWRTDWRSVAGFCHVVILVATFGLGIRPELWGQDRWFQTLTLPKLDQSLCSFITVAVSNHYKCRHAKLLTFGGILSLSRHFNPAFKTILCDRIIKNSTFLSTNGLFQAENVPKHGRPGLYHGPHSGSLRHCPSRLEREWTPLPIPLSAFSTSNTQHLGLILFSYFEKLACLWTSARKKKLSNRKVEHEAIAGRAWCWDTVNPTRLLTVY